MCNVYVQVIFSAIHEPGKCGEQINREEGYISETIQKTQSLFADQTPGQALTSELGRLLYTLISAETNANAIHDRIAPYMAQISK